MVSTTVTSHSRLTAHKESNLDGDALFSLKLHRVHLGTNAILATHIVDAVDAASVELREGKERHTVLSGSQSHQHVYVSVHVLALPTHALSAWSCHCQCVH